jgi:1-acyl-sn-glycerol-3-phosphate acyltransferase
MLEAHKDCWRKRLIIRVNGLDLRHYLAGVHVQGNLAALARDDRATLYFANHVTCWDGILAGYLSHRHLHQDPFIMTAEDSMLPRTTWDGNFSVNRNDPFSATQSLRYSVRLLQEVPRCALWIFPQGVILPFDKRPLDFRKGLAIIASQVKDVRVVPVGFYYTIIKHRKPEVFVSFGDPIHLALKTRLSRLTSQLEGCLVEHLDKLDNDLRNGDTHLFQTLLRGLSIREQLERLKGCPLSSLKAWDSPPQSIERVVPTAASGSVPKLLEPTSIFR